MRSPGPDASGSKSSQKTVQREPSDDYEDYEDQYEYSKSDGLQHKMEDLQLEHEDDGFADTTMLDSVILPAIASVSIYRVLIQSNRLLTLLVVV
jgi:serine/threonine-protein kinase 24/25/MST4